uniref:LysE family translocator n=1 Tax=Roseovarius halophilus (ex Wu et al. 2025) TaxID=3376060 RepID=UPI00399C33FF
GRAAAGLGRAVRRGFLTNVLNPKTALFIFAFIPQFTDPSNGPLWAQITVLGAIFAGLGGAFSLALGAAAGGFAHVLRARARLLNRVAAVMFGGLAARLLLQ